MWAIALCQYIKHFLGILSQRPGVPLSAGRLYLKRVSYRGLGCARFFVITRRLQGTAVRHVCLCFYTSLEVGHGVRGRVHCHSDRCHQLIFDSGWAMSLPLGRQERARAHPQPGQALWFPIPALCQSDRSQMRALGDFIVISFERSWPSLLARV